MCEYCGCQDIPAIALLTAEHDTIVNLMGQVRAALADSRLDAAAHGCRRILTVLGPHVHVEEQALFPRMRDEFPGQIDSLLAEHRTIETVLVEASDGTPSDPTWPARLTAALHDLREHILKEQDGVFPASLAILGPPEWDLLALARASAAAPPS